MFASLMQDILQLTEGNKSNLWTFIHIFRFQFFTVKISGGKKIIVVLNNENKTIRESSKTPGYMPTKQQDSF